MSVPKNKPAKPAPRSRQAPPPPPATEPAADDQAELLLAYDFEELRPRLEEIRADLGLIENFDATVFVYKQMQGVKSPPQVWSGPPDQYDMRAIAREHGSGEYRYVLYVRDQNGVKARRLNEVVAVQLSPKELRAYNLAMKEANDPQPDRQAAAGAGDLQQLMGVMMAGFQETIKALAPATAPRDPLADFVKISEVIKAAMPAVPAAPTFMETLAQLKMVNDTIGSGRGDRGGDPGTAVLMKAIETLGAPLAEGLKKQATTQPAAPIAPPAAGAESNLTDEEEEAMLLLKLQLTQACRTAAAGEDPADYADKIYSVLPDEAFALMIMPDWFPQLCTVAPAVAGYQPWFERVRAALIDLGIEAGDLIKGSDGVVQLAPLSDTVAAHENGAGAWRGNPAGAKLSS
jgi:hypothetical protein